MPWCYNAMMLRCSDARMLWGNDAMMQRNYDAMMLGFLWCYDAMLLWCNDAMMLWWYDAMVLLYYDALVLWCYDATMLWFNDAMLSGRHYVMMLWWYDAMMLWSPKPQNPFFSHWMQHLDYIWTGSTNNSFFPFSRSCLWNVWKYLIGSWSITFIIFYISVSNTRLTLVPSFDETSISWVFNSFANIWPSSIFTCLYSLMSNFVPTTNTWESPSLLNFPSLR